MIKGTNHKPLTDEQYHKVFGKNVIVDLFLLTGLRLRELKRLVDIFQHHDTFVDIHTKKSGNKTNRIYLVEKTIMRLQHLAKINQFRNKCLATFSRAVQKTSNECGIYFTAHHLRKTFGTRLHQRGFDIKIIQTLMNHKNIASTVEYIVPSEQSLRGALTTLANPFASLEGLTLPETYKLIANGRINLLTLEKENQQLKKHKATLLAEVQQLRLVVNGKKEKI